MRNDGLGWLSPVPFDGQMRYGPAECGIMVTGLKGFVWSKRGPAREGRPTQPVHAPTAAIASSCAALMVEIAPKPVGGEYRAPCRGATQIVEGRDVRVTNWLLAADQPSV